MTTNFLLCGLPAITQAMRAARTVYKKRSTRVGPLRISVYHLGQKTCLATLLFLAGHALLVFALQALGAVPRVEVGTYD